LKKNKSEAAPPPAAFPWGYIFGGGLCLVGLIVLSVALGTALRSATRGVHMLRAPGVHELELRNAGVYVGLYPHKGEGDLPLLELGALEFGLSDAATGERLPVQKAPGGAVFRQGGQSGVVLFQFETPSRGKYLLTAAAPAGDVPARELLLVHESLQQNRSDIAAGAIFFLVLTGFGVYVLIKTYKEASRG
jgi:hypothetical protein